MLVANASRVRGAGGCACSAASARAVTGSRSAPNHDGGTSTGCSRSQARTTALVTGADRGLGRALVDALLDRGAARVYAAARDPATVRVDDRITALPLDLTDLDSITRLADAAADVELLIYNAGAARFAGPLTAGPAAVSAEFAVNVTGLLNMLQAFAPILTERSGAVVNILTLLSYAPAPAMAGYSASKAAAHSLTQSVRPGLVAAGVSVHAVYPGGIDIDILAGFDAPKSDPRLVAEAILDGVAAGTTDIYPDPMSQQLSALWATDQSAFIETFAALA